MKHGGRFGGSISPNPRSVAQSVVTPPQHFQLQQHHLQKPNNQQLEVQTYQLQQQNYQQQFEQQQQFELQQQQQQLQQQQQQLQQQQQQFQQQQQQQQNYNVATVSRDYNQHYPSATLPYKKPGTGFTETSSILKKHRDEVTEMVKPQSSVFSIETSSQRQPDSNRSSKSISIINQPLPEIPKHAQMNDPQVLSAANLSNYRSLQRPQPSNKSSYPSGTVQRSSREQREQREQRPVIPMKVSAPPILPPKNRQQSRNQQPLPNNNQRSSSHGFNQQQQYPSKSYERERERDRDREKSRDRDRSLGRSIDDSHQYRSSSKQPQNQFGTLPHHHHHPSASSYAPQVASSKSRKSDSSKSLQRSSREMTNHRFENYSATEL